jgi:hypothetical protein
LLFFYTYSQGLVLKIKLLFDLFLYLLQLYWHIAGQPASSMPTMRSGPSQL